LATRDQPMGTLERLTWFQFVERKLRVAEALDKRECGGSYVEACIITGALLSGIAADLWPGDGIDRVRFAELWARFGWDIPSACHISVPLLSEYLRQKGREEEADTIEKARPEMFGPGYSTVVPLGSDVDMTDQALSRLCPTLATAELRKFSYPAVFYREIRSGLFHEYTMGKAATDWRMTEKRAEVSYVNMAWPDGRETRLIHFDMPWLTKLVLAIARRAEPSVDAAPLKDPPIWWLDEGLEQPPKRRRRGKKRS
jgi:hypothetical protein